MPRRFNIGDRVRVIDNPRWILRSRAGSELTVWQADVNHIGYWVASQSGFGNGGVYEIDLELADDITDIGE